MYVVVVDHRLRIRPNRKGTLLILSQVYCTPKCTVTISCSWLHYIVIRFFSTIVAKRCPQAVLCLAVQTVDDHCLVISYCVFVLFGDQCLEYNQPKLRFPTNVGTERGQASFASCICFYILGACVYPYRGQDLVWKPVCHWGEPSRRDEQHTSPSY